MTLLTPPRPVPGSVPRNGLPWKPYRCQGTGKDVLTAFMDDECWCAGDISAYNAHLRLGEPTCARSRAANAAANRRQHAARQARS